MAVMLNGNVNAPIITIWRTKSWWCWDTCGFTLNTNWCIPVLMGQQSAIN